MFSSGGCTQFVRRGCGVSVWRGQDDNGTGKRDLQVRENQEGMQVTVSTLQSASSVWVLCGSGRSKCPRGNPSPIQNNAREESGEAEEKAGEAHLTQRSYHVEYRSEEGLWFIQRSLRKRRLFSWKVSFPSELFSLRCLC